MKRLKLFLSGMTLSTVLLIQACSETESNVVLGTLERDRISLRATASEIITEQPLPEGSQVQRGDLLVQLDSRQQVLIISGIDSSILQQQAFLEQLKNGPRQEEIAAARARMETAEANRKESKRDLERIRDLVKKQLSARADQDTAETRLESNEARERDAQAQLQLLLSGTREEEIRQAQARLTAIKADKERELLRLADMSVRATRSGTLDSLPFNTGERVNAGAQLAILLSDQAPYARVYIPEPYRTIFTPGNYYTVHVDGIEHSFQGTLRWIAAEPAFTPYFALNSSERSHLVYLAEIQLPDSAATLPAGIPVQVELP